MDQLTTELTNLYNRLHRQPEFPLVTELTNLYNHLRRQPEFPLGIDQFLLLTRALRLGFGLENDDALRRLCLMLWVESQEEIDTFNKLFNQFITPFPQEEAPTDPTPKPTTPPKSQEDKPAKEEDKTEAKKELPKEKPTPPEPIEPPPKSEPGPQVSLPLLAGEMEIAYDPQLLFTEYLPVTERQMKQSWRFLRRMVREGPPVEINVPATIDKLVRDGFLLAPVLQPRRTNKATLLLLLDQNGSMVPFKAFATRLAKTAKETGHLAKLAVYHFHNCPPVQPTLLPTLPGDFYREHLLFQKPQCVQPVPASQALAEFGPTLPGVVIFSDGGAARGGWSQERIESTATFIFQLRALGVEYMAWMNPMPAARWQKSSAAEIAKFVPMLSLDAAQMSEAVQVLSGRFAGITGW
ncbi:MAG: hypothetical protein H6656_12080 [Ardenticatenaceae bacterium]|nr:hypothetical protein [Ardenticatenaceae bacterium]